MTCVPDTAPAWAFDKEAGTLCLYGEAEATWQTVLEDLEALPFHPPPQGAGSALPLSGEPS